MHRPYPATRERVPVAAGDSAVVAPGYYRGTGVHPRAAVVVRYLQHATVVVALENVLVPEGESGKCSAAWDGEGVAGQPLVRYAGHAGAKGRVDARVGIGYDAPATASRHAGCHA